MLPASGLEVVLLAVATMAAAPAASQPDALVEGVVQSVRLQGQMPVAGGTYSTILKIEGQSRIFRTDGRSEWIAPLLFKGDRVVFRVGPSGEAVGIERAPLKP